MMQNNDDTSGNVKLVRMFQSLYAPEYSYYINTVYKMI